MKLPKKERIFICHNEGDIKDFDVRESMPVWREIKSLFDQFKNCISKLKLKKEDKKKLELLTFYLEKVVEHYDLKVPEFSFSILCSIIESVGSESKKIYGYKRFKMALKKYFDPKYVEDQKFMKKMKEIYYTIGRCSFSHAVERLHWTAQIGSQANLPLMKDNKGEYIIIGNKHLFQIAITIITNYFKSRNIKEIP